VKLRAFRQDHTIITVAAVMFGLGLAAINVLWPKAFVVTIAIGGVLGAFMVLYEVRMTKRLAQAEFVRDLQTSFADNDNVQAVWAKLLLGEEIGPTDRPAVSSYLTFFETLHLLIDKGTLDLSLTEDLFRNRFFKAVGDDGILKIALARDKGSFANIHELIRVWHDYLVYQGIPIHPGYYAYVRGMLTARGYEVRQLTAEDLPELLRLQDEVLEDLRPSDWMRANDEAMLKECVTDPKHMTIGALQGDRLVGAAVLFEGELGAENIRRYFTDDPAALGAAINLKLVLVSPDKQQRRAGLGRTLVELLEQEAAERGKREILCTIHPDNALSRALFKLLGYRRLKSVGTAYGKREVYVRQLPVLTQQWAR
jgi:ribosomal protein S18 acetylase RimI-like enzyme